jgi:hypothetical protein
MALQILQSHFLSKEHLAIGPIRESGGAKANRYLQLFSLSALLRLLKFCGVSNGILYKKKTLRTARPFCLQINYLAAFTAAFVP